MSVMWFIILSMVIVTSNAWNLHASLSNATAQFFDKQAMFQVYLLPEEILGNIVLSRFNCSLQEENDPFVVLLEVNLNTTVFQWKGQATAEHDNYSINITCIPFNTSEKNTSVAPSVSPAPLATTVDNVGTGALPSTKNSTEASTMPTSAPAASSSTVKAQPRAKREAVKASTTPPPPTPPTPSPPLQGNGTSSTQATSVGDQASTSSGRLSTSSAAFPKDEKPSGTSTSTEPVISATTNASITLPAASSATSVNSTLQSSAVASTTLASALIEEAPDGETTYTLVIRRVSWDYVQAQAENSLEGVVNITRGMDNIVANGKELQSGTKCYLFYKDVRVIDKDYVLLMVAADKSSGQTIYAGHMQRDCNEDDWSSATSYIADMSRLKSQQAKNSQLQIIVVVLAVLCVVFALLAVFLCTKWRLSVRGSRQVDEFYVKTFHTKEHHYKPDDDAYGFPTVRRDRNSNNISLSPRSTSFVNGAFNETVVDTSLPPPPPELRGCLINDANFTEVPLHNLAHTESLPRAHRGVNGVYRHTSPPPPPIRTVSSGYHTPSVIYHNPREVMPDIPKEDYSDSDSEQTTAERKGRFHVRTAL